MRRLLRRVLVSSDAQGRDLNMQVQHWLLAVNMPGNRRNALQKREACNINLCCQ